MVNRSQIFIVVSLPELPSHSSGRSSSLLDHGGVLVREAKSVKSGGFLKKQKPVRQKPDVLFDLDGADGALRREIYLADENDLEVLVGEGLDHRLVERTEETLRKALSSVDEEMSGTTRLQIALQSMQAAGLLEPFDIATFLACLREYVRNGRRGEIDYLGHCRRPHEDMKQKEKGKWGFWLSHPQGDGRVRSTSDPYGGLM